jgi:arsenate reductase (glutaredoxin)
MKMYAIPNCETVKKARSWLESRGLAYEFHDYKKLGIDAATLKRWCKEFGYEQVLNQRGTTWRKLDESVRTSMTEAKALKLMQEQPSIIKRPIIDTGARLLLGFDEATYQQSFK